MSIQAYKEINFKQPTLDLIEVMNQIVRKWQADGYTMTVRQLYYQLVARAVIENTMQSYKRICNIVNDARMAGLMRWDGIEDRTREFITRGHWNSPQGVLDSAARGYHMDLWETQDERVFIIVEKEALVGILEGVCHDYDIPLLAARGYPSGTVLREFALSMLMPALNNDQTVKILHLGDHDPSGIDMTRDLTERLETFCQCDEMGTYIELHRIALTMEQIEDQRPPPNPAKADDSRFTGYAKKYGKDSWELDALSPDFVNDLVLGHIQISIDDDAMDARRAEIELGRTEIRRVAQLINFPRA